MSRDAEDDDHTTFFRMSLSEDDDDDSPVVSRAGFMLHAAAINNSVTDGTPGFISDDYLNAISAETTVTAGELCLLGLWERDDDRGGYVINDPLVEQAVGFHARMAADRAHCVATGGHETNGESGPNLCCKCWSRIDREDVEGS